MAHVKIGDRAPDFDLPGDGGARHSLSALRGRNVVLFFYPKDNTPACSSEAVDFTAHKAAFEAAGTVVIGVSPDSAKRHANFRKKYDLDVPLVADTERTLIDAWGLWVEKSMFGRKYMGVERTTVLIDAEGQVNRIWRKVSVPGHAAEVLEAARALTSR